MKKFLIYGLIVLVIILVTLLVLLYSHPTVAVLGYHDFEKDKDIDNSNTFILNIDKFEKQLKYLKKHHYKTLTLNEFYEYKQNKKKFPRKSVLITMDDGYQSNYELAFPLLKKYNMNATVFCIGKNTEEGWAGYMSKETLKKVKKEYPNIDIASHSYNLHEKGAYNFGKDALREDFSKCKNVIQTEYLAYPFGDYNESFVDVLKENNFKLAFTFGPGKEHRKARHSDSNYRIPRLCISSNMPMWKFAIRIALPY